MVDTESDGITIVGKRNCSYCKITWTLEFFNIKISTFVDVLHWAVFLQCYQSAFSGKWFHSYDICSDLGIVNTVDLGNHLFGYSCYQHAGFILGKLDILLAINTIIN